MRLLLLFLWLWAWAWAFPRVGVHEGFTRVVFDLPSEEVRYTLKRGENLIEVVLLGLKAPPKEEVVNSKEVASVQTLPDGKGSGSSSAPRGRWRWPFPATRTPSAWSWT